jgi:serine/threonine-protein kinase
LCPACLLKAGLGDGPIGAGEPGRLNWSGATGQNSSSALVTLANTMGQMPLVLLRDSDPEIDPGSAIAPPTPELPATAGRSGRLHLFGVIARGGMGLVLKGRDTDLGRDLAVKVLLEEYRDHPELVRRFIEEAQIGGQLQHPGVVPVYELGTFADGRPYIAMKLIKGRTLAELLKGRGTPADERPRLIGIFESVCQTMAYAHVRGVIHRDLKPSNIMVGSFGEVQVMDWGLAKVLARGGAVDDALAGRVDGPSAPGEGDVSSTVIATRRDNQAERSRPGSVLGTPAYMAPEQARGEVEILDERTDVFALGSILCEILTGWPAFTGRTSTEIDRRAASGDVAEAHARLGACGADAELIALARDCLAVAPSGRPHDARVVAERVSTYRIGVQEKLRAAELATVEAQARADEESKRRGLSDRLATEAQAHAVAEGRRRRATLGLAASVLTLVVLVGSASAWFALDRQARLAGAEKQRQARLAGADLALREVEILRDQAAGDPEGDVGKWQDALRQARKLGDDLPTEVSPRRDELVHQIEQGAIAAERDRNLVTRLEEIRAGLDADVGADQAYADAFRAVGFDLLSPNTDPAAIGRQLAARPRSVAQAAAVSLDTWAVVRRSLDQRRDIDHAAVAGRLMTAARAADPDPWRNRLRDALDRRDLEVYRRLAQDKDLAQRGPVSLWLLGHGLEFLGDRPSALDVLYRARRAYPGDYWLNGELGLALLGGRRRGTGAQQSYVGLNPVKGREDDYQRAESYFLAAEALRPRFATAHFALAFTYNFRKKWDEALSEYREALRLKPDDFTIRTNLALSLEAHGDWDAALAEMRQLVDRAPHDIQAHCVLGKALARHGRLDEAAAAFQAAIRLASRRDFDHCGRAEALRFLGKTDEATVEYREFVRLLPHYFEGHLGLAEGLAIQGRTEAALAEIREAIRIAPDDSDVHVQIGRALETLGKIDEALAEHRLAIRLAPESFLAHANAALMLRRRGQFAESTDLFRKARELTTNPGDRALLAQDLARNESLAALAPRLAAVLRGDDQPRDPAERLAFADLAYNRKRYAQSAEWFAAALADKSDLAPDLKASYRYNAACAAALAAAGGNPDGPALDDATRVRMRRWARDWLTAELAACSEGLREGPAQARPQIQQSLLHSKMDPDLASIRDPSALTRLTEPERTMWQALWAEVDALLKQATMDRRAP